MTELSPSKAKAVLRKACAAAGLDPVGARLLRVGSNAVYRLIDPVIARISRTGASADQARRAVAVARWLESVDFPAVRAVKVDQPVTIDQHVVTFWDAVSDDGDQYATVAEVADILVRLHALKAPGDVDLPALAPFENAANRVETNNWLDQDDRMFLVDKLAESTAAYANLKFALPPGVIHGDASIGNVLRDYDGNPVLIDLDGFAIGPREWDVVLTAMYYDSFGWHTREEYETFVQIYGFDIMTWPGYPVLREIREFLMVTWVIQKATESTEIAAEASKRIEALRASSSRKDWQPY
jgi:aminoglycoside phosphotransferase (APT) family kinase protein